MKYASGAQCPYRAQVGFAMKRITKGGVVIKMWDLGGQVRSLCTHSITILPQLQPSSSHDPHH